MPRWLTWINSYIICLVDEHPKCWALILAAGEGTRLRSLTTQANGISVPKQFCSLRQGSSLLSNAISRASAAIPAARICAVVAAQHRHWWQPLLTELPPDNIVVQPGNRGTANGILLPLLHIVARDPSAHVVILPSDHHVRDESMLSAALLQGILQLQWRFEELLLLGIVPEEPDPELGYIVPGPTDGRGTLEVEEFVEKPDLQRARELIRRGGLWNAFIIVGSAQGLLWLFRQRMPQIVEEMQAAVRSDRLNSPEGLATAKLYEQLPFKDFSHDILQGQEPRLRVLAVPSCGWTDLGTPRRVDDVLRRTSSLLDVPANVSFLSLAAQQERRVRTLTPAH